MIRKAVHQEIEFYEKILYPFQDRIFRLIQNEKFYLSGGTCLSRFHYHHRFSDDLDFFFDGYRYSKEAFETESREIINRISEHFNTEMTVNGEYFKRFFVYDDRQPLKIEMIYENYKTIGIRNNIGHIFIDSKENLATNKLTAVYDRKTVKDFVDLYFLLREIDYEQIVQWAAYKIIPMDYEGVVITFKDRRLEGEVLLRKESDENEFESFVNELITKMFDHARNHQ